MAIIEGYCSTNSAFPGEKIGFHISSETKEFAWTLVRIGIKDEEIDKGTGRAEKQPNPIGGGACHWPESFNLTIKDSWSSGLYCLTLQGGTDPIFFIVRAARPAQSRILVMIPDATGQAYNDWNKYSFYQFSEGVKQVPWVSFHRPGRIMPGQGWYDWEKRFICWLEQEKYTVDYCTNVDLHRDPTLLLPYQLLISVGHDEYWSQEMRDHAEDFIKKGGNAAFFGGNNCYWQIRFEDDHRTVVSYKEVADTQDPMALTPDTQHLVTAEWHSPIVGRPSNTLIGVSSKYGAVWDFGGGQWVPAIADPFPYPLFGAGMRYRALPISKNNTLEYVPLPKVGYTVHFSKHWVFDKTQVTDGSLFGKECDLVGYETDAAQFEIKDGVPKVTGSDGTPPNFTVLASAELKLGKDVTSLPAHTTKARPRATSATAPNEGDGDESGIRHATLGLFLSRGVLFTASTTNWACGLWAMNPNTEKPDPVVEQITRNVLERLRRPNAGSPPIRNSQFLQLDGWYRERQGEKKDLSGAGEPPTIRIQIQNTPPMAGTAVSIDGAGGQVSVCQDLELLQGYTYYRVSCWVQANDPDTYIALQSDMNLIQAKHPGDGQWRLLAAIGRVDNKGPLFQARVALCVPKGQASFTEVTVNAIGYSL